MSETSGTSQAPAPQGTRPSTPRSIRPREAGDYPLEEFIESRGFRPEIQGLRAFAVLLVVLYHVWFGRVSGGVDVFLFISAFLLSLSFMRKINEGLILCACAQPLVADDAGRHELPFLLPELEPGV